VVQIAEEFVKAMYAREVFVHISEMILSELARFVTLRLQDSGKCDSPIGQSYVGTRLADGRQTCTYRQLAGDEIRATCGAASLGIVIGEHHALGSKFVEIWRPSGHDSSMVRADVKPPNVVAHDDENVRLLVLRPRCVCGGQAYECADD